MRIVVLALELFLQKREKGADRGPLLLREHIARRPRSEDAGASMQVVRKNVPESGVNTGNESACHSMNWSVGVPGASGDLRSAGCTVT